MLILTIIFSAIVVASAWAYVFVFDEEESIFSPFVWYLLFHTFVFFVRPASGDLFGDYWVVFEYMMLIPDESDRILTYNIANFALVVYFFSHVTTKIIFQGVPVTSKFFNSPISWRGIVFSWAVLGTISVYSAIFEGAAVLVGGGIERDRVNGVAVNVGQVGYLTDAQFMLIGLSVMLACKANFKMWSLMPIIAFFFYRSLMGWGRWSIVLGVLGLFLLWLRMNGKKWPPIKFIFPAALVGYLFSILGQDRGALQAMFLGKISEDSLYKEKRSMFEEVFDALDFANYDYLLYISKHIPDSTGTYTYGLQHLQLFTEPIPRILWAGKPAGAPIQFFNLNDYGNFVGLTYSVVGDGWASGGFIGVLLTIAVLAFFLGMCYRFFLKYAAIDLVGSICYICFSALFVQIFRDGSLVTLVKFGAFVLIPVIFAAFFNEKYKNK